MSTAGTAPALIPAWLQERASAAFRPAGLLAAASDNYEYRSGQMEMAAAVAKTINEEGTLIVEGPCGTGKSKAYLVPAIYAAVYQGKQAYVLTENKALQEQLMVSELPALEKALTDVVFTYGLFKGLNNYLCNHKMTELGAMYRGHWPSDLVDIATWSRFTRDGDRKKAPVVRDDTWDIVSMKGDDCLKDGCPSRDDCHGKLAQAKAKTCNVVVCNYDVFLRIGQYMKPSEFPDVIICDEVHALADKARDIYGSDVKPGSIRRIARQLMSVDELGGRRLEDSSARAFATIEKMAYSQGYLKERLAPGEMTVFREVSGLVLGAARTFSSKAAVIAACSDPDDGLSEKDARAMAVFERQSENAARVAGILAEFEKAKPGDNVRYIDDDDGRSRPFLKFVPVTVGLHLLPSIYRVPSLIMTSATVVVCGSSSHLETDLGIKERTDEPTRLVISSPFDFSTQTKLVIPVGVKPPRGVKPPLKEKLHHAWLEDSKKIILAMAKKYGGRTMCLFWTNADLEAVVADLRKTPYTIICQHDGDTTEQIEKFKNTPGSILLGVKSLWTGVDIPGDALKAVVISKIPIPVTKDPLIMELRDRAGGDSFDTVCMQRALLMFRQGLGRLIRTTTDTGMIVLTDEAYVDRIRSCLPDGLRIVRHKPEFKQQRKG